jgi:hypothetical protein
MSSKVLELEQLHLTSVSDKLRLSTTSSADFRMLSSNIDIKTPESVLFAEFKRLHISLEFHTIPDDRRPRPKRTKTRAKVDETVDAMLLDIPSTAIDDKHLRDLEEVVGSLSQGLSTSIASCFEFFQNTDLDQRLFPRLSQISKKFSTASIPPSIKWGDGRSLSHTSTALDPAAKLPSQGLGRYAAPSDALPLYTQSDEEDMLLPSDRNIALPTALEPSDHEMLFSQTTESTPSLASQSTTISTSSVASSVFSLKRSSPFDSSISVQAEALGSLNISPACKLAEIALRILIGGYEPRRSRCLLGVRVDKPPPEMSLSDLAPGVFSPAFKEVCSPELHSQSPFTNMGTVNVTQCSLSTHDLSSNILLVAAKCPVANSEAKARSASKLPSVTFGANG